MAMYVICVKILSDNYFRYPAIEAVVREQLQKVKALDAEIAKIEGLASTAIGAQEAQENFFNAVFTGVIRLERAKTTFTYEQFGMEQVLDLQNSSMPYGAKAPLYQAYLTYKELDEDMKGMIRERATDAMDNMTDEIYEVSKQIKARYTSDFLKMTLSKVAMDKDRKEIQAFYQEFMQALQNYILTYM